jgi:biopolymer transport protein ExbB
MQTQPVPMFGTVLRWCLLVLLAMGAGGTFSWGQDAATEPVAVESDVAPAADQPQKNAERVGKISTNVIDMINSLGVWNIPFAMASIVFLWFTVDRLVALRRGRVIPKPFVQRFIRLLEDGEMEQDEALQVCQENQSPIANIFAHAVRKWGKPSVEVEQAIIDGGERQVSELRTNLRVLHGIHTITPMLGLLGTVWGMLDSFSQIAFAGAMGQTDQLAQGIALALVTTVVGLVIAIPALVMHMYFSGKIDSLVMEMDDLSQRVVHCISAEGLMSRMVQARKPSPSAEPAGARGKR